MAPTAIDAVAVSMPAMTQAGRSVTTIDAPGTVALFDASDDTVDMIRTLLLESGHGQILVGCHFADLKKGIISLETFLAAHNPEVVVFDLSPPYEENWHCFVQMRESLPMRGRGIVLTTTHKIWLDAVLGQDSFALEVVGRAQDLHEIDQAIRLETRTARAGRDSSRVNHMINASLR